MLRWKKEEKHSTPPSGDGSYFPVFKLEEANERFHQSSRRAFESINVIRPTRAWLRRGVILRWMQDLVE